MGRVCGVFALSPFFDVCSSSGACSVLMDGRFFLKTGINGQRVVLGGHFEVFRGSVLVRRLYRTN